MFVINADTLSFSLEFNYKRPVPVHLTGKVVFFFSTYNHDDYYLFNVFFPLYIDNKKEKKRKTGRQTDRQIDRKKKV